MNVAVGAVGKDVAANDTPVSEHCDCLTCRRYSRGYLHHLYHIKDATFMRLATIHNLRFMSQVVERLSESVMSW